MEQRQLGRHGLTVSNLGLGTRTWGLDTEPQEASEILQTFLTAGGTYVQLEGDPAFPEPVRVLGQELRGGTPRSSLVLGLRSGFFPGSDGPASRPSRGALLDSLDLALEELGCDHLDLWLLSGPLGDVELGEALSALELAYRSGRARYVGVGDVSWWNAGSAKARAEAQGWDLAAWSAEVSLLAPTILASGARELRRSGMGVIAGAPLGGGVLTGKYRHSTPPDSRAASPRFRPEIQSRQNKRAAGVIEAATRAAEGLDKSAAQVALAWVTSIPQVSTAVVGPRSTRQLEHLLEGSDWSLPPAIFEVLTEVAVR